MKFIQIKDGVCVRKSAIESIERLETGGTKVFTNSAVYECPFVYEAIRQLLEIEDIEEQVQVKAPPAGEGSWGSQFWRG